MNKRNLWEYEETIELLSIMVEQNSLKYFGGKQFKNNEIFKKIEVELKKRGYPNKDSKQIEYRWKNLKKKYVKIKRMNCRDGKSLCPFFDELNSMLSDINFSANIKNNSKESHVDEDNYESIQSSNCYDNSMQHEKVMKSEYVSRQSSPSISENNNNSAMKWSNNDIIEFLSIYEQNSILWDISHRDYFNMNIKQEAFKALCEQLDNEGLLKGLSEKQLRARIKSIKDMYRQELAKIEMNKRYTNENEAVYSSKLVWFDVASFLAKSSRRRRNSPFSIQQNTKPIKSLKQFKRSLEIRNQDVYDERPYDQFGKYVAAELRQLPHRQAILLQQELQNTITRSKLSCLESGEVEFSNYEEQLEVDIALPSRSSSVEAGSDDDYDVLGEPLINSLDENDK